MAARPRPAANRGGAGELTRLATHRATLEDVFIQLTGKALRDE